MFYKMIENKCTQWYESERCTVKSIIEYIEKAGQMRDAQIEAIKVYLFLKIACECKPLTQLFRQGFFNSIDLNEIELSKSTREYLFQNIRKAFCDKTDFNTIEELIPEEANLLNIANFTSEIYADNLDDYYPRQNVVENIMADDKGKLKVDKKTQQLIDLAIETGNDRIVLELQQRVSSHPNKNRSFHYLTHHLPVVLTMQRKYIFVEIRK